MINWRIWPYIGLFTLALLVYLNFMSNGLDDFDSFTFALALERPQSAWQLIHAPGFPVYLGVAWALAPVIGSTQVTLTIISAISGAIGVVMTAAIGAALGSRRAGLLAGGLMLFVPVYWISAEMALSDMPGLALTLSAVCALVMSARPEQSDSARTFWFMLGCGLAGVSLGLRPHNAIAIALAGIYALVGLRRIRLRGVIMALLGGLLIGLAGVMIWLIPTAGAYGDLSAYVESINAHRLHVQSSDSLFRQDLTLTAVTDRFAAFGAGWQAVLSGGGHVAAFGLVLVLSAVGIVSLRWRHRLTIFGLIWLIAAGGVVFFVASLERPRLFLPALPPMMLLIASGYVSLSGRWRWLRVGAVILLAVFIWRSVPLVMTLTTTEPPLERATEFIRSEYPLEAGSAVIVAQGTFQAAQYRLPQYPQLYTPYYEPDAWAQDITNRRPDHLIVLDGDDIAPEILETITQPYHYVAVTDRVFERDRRVFPQHSTVRLQVFVPLDAVRAEDLQLPMNGQIVAGDPADSRFFGEGWYRTELIGDVPGRWANEDVVVRVTLPETGNWTMTFTASPYVGDQSVTVIVNDETVMTLPLDTIWGDYTVTIPADLIQVGDINTIMLRHAAADFPDGHNRQLAASYSRFVFVQSQQ